MGPQSVLIVDPDVDSLDIYSLVLEANGMRVIRAREHEAGFAAACESRPDVMVLDVGPLRDAVVDLVERLRSDPRTSGVPIIVTGTVPMPSKHRARDVCDGFLLKPCIPTRVLTEVRRFLPEQPTAS